MRRYVLTGAPGSGKTSVLAALRARGYPVVAEAATDVIAVSQAQGTERPWTDPGFTASIAALQRSRHLAPAPAGSAVQFFDRSPVCTLALARFLGHPVPAILAAEAARIVAERFYERDVFLIRPLGFIEPTAARRISYAESLEFERVHEQEYARLGFRLVEVPPASVSERAALIEVRVGGAAPYPALGRN